MPKALILCGESVRDATGQVTIPNPCNFGYLITLAQNLITDLIFLSTIFATVAFAYAGFKLLTSGGSEKAKDEAVGIFKKVGLGYLWILVAWLLVYTITSLLAPGFSILGAPGQQ